MAAITIIIVDVVVVFNHSERHVAELNVTTVVAVVVNGHDERHDEGFDDNSDIVTADLDLECHWMISLRARQDLLKISTA